MADGALRDRLFAPAEWPSHLHGTPSPSTFVTLKSAALAALTACDLDEKVRLTRETAWSWFGGTLGRGGDAAQPLPDRPGRPQRPNLVAPRQLKKRSLHTEHGRFALLHAIAHIELNAVDLALDIIARFSAPEERMPRSFYDGWMRVALEEAKHFSLLRERLGQLGGAYGDLDAHDGLWEAASATKHGLRARLAVVPLILEARGLDITPQLLRQMEQVGDHESRRIFEIIYRDEEGHVAVGAKWFRYLCLRDGVNAAEAFQTLVRSHFRGPVKPPFNDLARARAGLTPGFYRALSSAGT